MTSVTGLTRLKINVALLPGRVMKPSLIHITIDNSVLRWRTGDTPYAALAQYSLTRRDL